MRLSVNGVARTAPDGATVADVVAEIVPGAARGIAVAVDGAVVRRGEWAATRLRDGAAVEVLTAAQGG
jgi:sulfur carrier protein